MPISSSSLRALAPHPNIDAATAALAQARHTTVQQFITYYLGIHPASFLPGRSAFDPVAIPRLLPHLVLAEVERQGGDLPARFRIKVAGDEVVAAMRMPLIGRYLDEIANTSEPTARFPIESRHAVVDTGRLVYRRGKPRMRFSLDYAEVEYVHCPLAEDGVNVDHVLTVNHYQALEPVIG
jgi:hypothetical protein